MRVIFLSSSNLLLRASRFYRHRSVSDVNDASGTSLRMTHHASSDLRMKGSTHCYGNRAQCNRKHGVGISGFFIACSHPFGTPNQVVHLTNRLHSLFIYYFVYCLFYQRAFMQQQQQYKSCVCLPLWFQCKPHSHAHSSIITDQRAFTQMQTATPTSWIFSREATFVFWQVAVNGSGNFRLWKSLSSSPLLSILPKGWYITI